MTTDVLLPNVAPGAVDAHSKHSQLHDSSPPSHPFFKDHASHGPNPLYTSMGWGNEGHCGYESCPHYDAELHEMGGKADRADFSDQWETHEIQPHNARLVAHESTVDIEHLQDLDFQDVPPKATNNLPRLIPHDGAFHIMDGHHRLAADAMNGRTTKVSIYRGE